MEDKFIDIDCMSFFFESHSWISKINLLLRKAERKLLISRTHFRREVAECADSIYLEFEQTRERIKTFPEKFDFKFYKENLSAALGI